ncbi:MAG: molybdenum cofactor guanylyltransferase [Chloroflexi bacterium]|nr:molybdenum cofactor guanylyltransferase [Chloroflexota bacterium]
MQQASAIILAGGKSSRMGTDKAWLEWNGEPLIVRVMQRVAKLADEILISANDAARFAALDARVIPDTFPGAGPLAGIYASLDAAKHAAAIVVACDMPFLNVGLLEYMLSFAEDYDVVLPNLPGAKRATDTASGAFLRAKDLDLHPLHAVYTKHCLASMRAALERGERRTIGFHSEVRVRVVTPDESARFDPLGRSVWNVNTPEEWAELSKLSF